MKNEVSALVNRFGLLPHPEGGYYKETYRSKEIISQNALPERFTGDRHFATAIYFLLEKNNFSAFHRIKSDECWHFYGGDGLLVHVIQRDGKYRLFKLGNRIEHGEVFQAIVSAGSWFASETTGDYSFAGCTVAPGFDFADFELAQATELIKEFPQHEILIERLCRQ